MLFQMTKALVVLEQIHEVSRRSNRVYTVIQHRTFSFKPGNYLSKCGEKIHKMDHKLGNKFFFFLQVVQKSHPITN